MLSLKAALAPVSDYGLRLQTYPNYDKPGTGIWVLAASSLDGTKSTRIEVNGTLLAQAFPAEGGKFEAERLPDGSWSFRLLHADTLVLSRTFPPDTSVFVAMKDFFAGPLLMSLAPHLFNLTQTLGRM